jgi:hypothetical protein
VPKAGRSGATGGPEANAAKGASTPHEKDGRTVIGRFGEDGRNSQHPKKS